MFIRPFTKSSKSQTFTTILPALHLRKVGIDDKMLANSLENMLANNFVNSTPGGNTPNSSKVLSNLSIPVSKSRV
jgi:hypothetical protein